MVGSNSAKEDLVKFGVLAKNISIVPHGVLLEKSKIIPNKNKIKTITYLGVLVKDKGVEDAIKAFSILDKKGKYNFWIIGKGEESYKNYLFSLCEKHGITDNLTFWGFVNQKKKFELLAKSHILINPSVREGWGLVNIEANSVGTPVVAYNSAGLIDSIKQGYSGFLCEENKPRHIAAKVEDLIDKKAIYKKLQQTSILWSKRFNWDQSRKLSLDLIKRIAN